MCVTKKSRRHTLPALILPFQARHGREALPAGGRRQECAGCRDMDARVAKPLDMEGFISILQNSPDEGERRQGTGSDISLRSWGSWVRERRAS